MSDESAFDGLIATLRAFDAVGADIATDALPAVLAAARATAAAGTTPEGEAWAPTKADGKPALPNAAGAISAVVSGMTKAVITLVLKGVYVFHQRSKSKGKKGLPRREILPMVDVPEAIASAIRASVQRVVARQVRAR